MKVVNESNDKTLLELNDIPIRISNLVSDITTIDEVIEV